MASGIDLSIGTGGVKLATAPLLSILSGGIVFDTPDEALHRPPSPPNSRFWLYADQKAADEAAEPVHVSYRLYFPDAARGVEVGTPVDLRGLPIGQVTAVRLEYDPTADAILEPVTIEVAPHRIKLNGQRLDTTGQDPVAATNRMFTQLVAKGLRAQLVSANLLTGQRAIDFDFVDDAPPAQLVSATALPRAADGRGEQHRSDHAFGEQAVEQACGIAAGSTGGTDPRHGRTRRWADRPARGQALSA